MNSLNNYMFSFYDFLGYLIPGSFLVIMIRLISEFKLVDNEWSYKIDIIKNENIFTIIVLMYILGHILSFLSAITVERYSIWTLGYPSTYLLNYEKGGYYKSIKTHNNTRVFMRTFVWIILFPITIFDTIFKFNNIISAALDEQLQCAVKRCICNNLRENYKIYSICKDTELDFLRILYHEIVRSGDKHFNKLQNYVALYGFSRTIALVLVIAFYFSIYRLYKYSLWNINFIIFIFLLWVSSILLYYSYNKFSKKYTLEVLMAYLVMNKSKNENFFHKCKKEVKNGKF